MSDCPLPPAILTLPCWTGSVSGVPLHGGLSNEIWKVTDAAGHHVVRLGRDYPFHHVSRAREAMISRAAHDAGFGPAVRYSAPGVIVTAFVNARTYQAGDLCANPARIGRLLKSFHTTMPAHISGEATLFWVFHVIRDYARTLTAGHSAYVPDLPVYLALSAAWEAAQIPLPIIFGHNDLLPANILEDEHQVWLIDFEYAGFSTALFDLAGAASNAGMTDEQSEHLLHSYFGTSPAPALRKAFYAMQGASLLREAMWAMVSALHLSAPGVDYAAYARENLTRLDAALDRYQSAYGKIDL